MSPRAPRSPVSTGLALVDGIPALTRPTIHDYCAASAEYVLAASRLSDSQKKAGQLRLSKGLAVAALEDLRDLIVPVSPPSLATAFAGEREVGGGLRSVKADVSEMIAAEGLTLAVEIKPVHLAVGRAIWNRFGDIRSFAVNVHLKFPFAVVGGVMTLPTTERLVSGSDAAWKSTTHLVSRAIERFVRAGGRESEGDAPHLMEGIAVVVFDANTGLLDPLVPMAGKNLRWDEFIQSMADAYIARFAVI